LSERVFLKSIDLKIVFVFTKERHDILKNLGSIMLKRFIGVLFFSLFLLCANDNTLNPPSGGINTTPPAPTPTPAPPTPAPPTPAPSTPPACQTSMGPIYNTGSYLDWKYETGSSVTEIAMSDAARRIAVGCSNGNLYLFERSSNNPLWIYHVADEQFTSVAISQTGSSVVAGCTDGSIYFFECDHTPPNAPSWVYNTKSGRGSVQDVAISQNGSTITACDHQKIYVFTWNNGTPLKIFTPTQSSKTQTLTTVVISSDGTTIAAGNNISNDQGSDLFLYNTSNLVWSHYFPYTYQGENSVEMPISISANGLFIACGGSDRKLYFFSRYNPSPSWSYDISSSDDQISTVCLSADGSKLLAQGADSCFYFGDANSRKLSWSFDGTFDPSDVCAYGVNNAISNAFGVANFKNGAAMSSDGELIVTAPYNSSYILNMQKDKNIAFSRYNFDNTDIVSSVAMSPDGAWVCAGGVFRGIVHLWELLPDMIVKVTSSLTLYIIATDDTTKIGNYPINYQYTIIKPGRAVILNESFSIFSSDGGEFSGGSLHEILSIPDGYSYKVLTGVIDVPKVYETYALAHPDMILRGTLTLANGTGSATFSKEDHQFMTVVKK
jgi:WD40 repeat protein